MMQCNSLWDTGYKLNLVKKKGLEGWKTALTVVRLVERVGRLVLLCWWHRSAEGSQVGRPRTWQPWHDKHTDHQSFAPHTVLVWTHRHADRAEKLVIMENKTCWLYSAYCTWNCVQAERPTRSYGHQVPGTVARTRPVPNFYIMASVTLESYIDFLWKTIQWFFRCRGKWPIWYEMFYYNILVFKWR